MLKVIKQKNEFKRSIIMATMLHIILLLGFIYNYFNSNNINRLTLMGEKPNLINVVMVDTNGVVENYKEQKKLNMKFTEKQIKKELQEEKKQFAKEPIKKSNKYITEKLNTPKTETQTQEKKAKKVVKKVVLSEKNIVENKSNTDKTQVSEDISHLFNDLTLNKNILNMDHNLKKTNTTMTLNNIVNKNMLDKDINKYAGEIKSSIESQFYDASSYVGKRCTLRIKLMPNGMLLDIYPEAGDPALCNAALAAARKATIPKPPSWAVYEVFKNAPIDFKP